MAPPVTSGLIAHYDATSLTASDGDSISQWDDETGNGHDLTQGTSSEQPIYRTNSFPSGEPALDFGPEHMESLTAIQPGSSMTFFVVVKVTGWNGNNPGLWREGSSGGGQDFHIFQGTTGLPWIRWNGTDVLKPSSGYSVPLDEPLVQTWRMKDASSAEFWTADTLRHSVTHSESHQPEIYHFFWQSVQSENVAGLYGEVLFYDRELTDTERADVESYLNDKWIDSSTAISAQPATLTATAQPATVDIASVTVDRTAVIATFAIGTIPVAGGTAGTTAAGVSISAQPVSLGLASQAANVVRGALAVSGQPAGVTTSAQVAKVSAGTIDITGQPATLTTTAQAASLVLGALAVSAQPATISTTAQAATVNISQPVSVSAQPATLTTTAQTASVNGSVVIEAQPGTISVSAQAATVSITEFADQVGAVVDLTASVGETQGGGFAVDLESEIVSVSEIQATMDIDLELTDVSETMVHQVRRQSFVMGDPG